MYQSSQDKAREHENKMEAERGRAAQVNQRVHVCLIGERRVAIKHKQLGHYI